MSESEDALSNWANTLAAKEKEANAEKRGGRIIAGTAPCPVCGAGLVNDRCLSCGYPKNVLTCPHCAGNYKNGEPCPTCGWTKDTPICRNCNADLIPGHMVRKVLEDHWAWKCCAYCGWPIERYLYRPIEYEPYVKPYEYHGHSDIGGLFGTVVVGVLAIFLIAALFGPVGSIVHLIPTGNLTQISPSNGNSTITAGPGLGPILQLYPLFFVFIALIWIAKAMSGHGRGF